MIVMAPKAGIEIRDMVSGDLTNKNLCHGNHWVTLRIRITQSFGAGATVMIVMAPKASIEIPDMVIAG